MKPFVEGRSPRPRTDSQIQHDVLATLAWDPSVDASAIGVVVCAGVVSLSGCVGTYTEKWMARHAIEQIGGVTALADEIQVELARASVRDDADIARSAQNVIEWITYLPVGSVCVEVDNGWVTLGGEVDWPFQKQGAEDGIASLMGVMGISNQIAVSTLACNGTSGAHAEEEFPTCRIG